MLPNLPNLPNLFHLYPITPIIPKFPINSLFWLDEIGSLRSPISLLLNLQEKKVFVSFAFGNLH